MHGEVAKIDIAEIVEAGPIVPIHATTLLMWFCVAVGTGVLVWGAIVEPAVTWAAFWSNLIFWSGLSMGGVVIAAILQIVRATWAAPVRRIAEAGVAFLPIAWVLVLVSYAGKEYLFPWARHPSAGREWWMQPDFVYIRIAILLAVLFLLMLRFVGLSVRSDIGLITEEFQQADRRRMFSNWIHRFVSGSWKGADNEILNIQRKLTWYAPVVILVYAVISSLFSFEMVMAMDEKWYSNMFGGFIFVGNIYTGWAGLSLMVIYLAARHPKYEKVLQKGQLQDLGNLTFAFTILWGYLFLAQFLPQWYGNMPEETQWMILRTREMPWKAIAWLTFSMCFIFPFITLLSRDVPRTPPVFATVCVVIILGVWLERYVIIMPEISPTMVPFSGIEVALFFGFLGLYVLAVEGFLSKFPFVPISHPQTHGSVEW